MPNLTGVINFFTRAFENTVPMTLSSSVTAGATTVPITGLTNYTDGDIVCLVVDPGTPALKQAFTGTKNGAAVINVVWTEFPPDAVNHDHAAGATVIDYVTATDWDMMSKGITTHANQDGTLKTSAVQAALNISGGAAGGWTPSGFAPSAVVYNGNRSYTCTFSADLTPTLSPGMRLRTSRTVASPTQAASLNGTTQYFNRSATITGMTFTNNFVLSAYVKLSAYPAGAADIVSRFNGTSGWSLRVTPTGQLLIFGDNAGAGNNLVVTSYQSVPLNKWVHVAAQLDMTGTVTTGNTNSYIMFDGVEVQSVAVRSGTNPIALVQAGNLEVGSSNGGINNLPGKVAQVAVYGTKIAQATIAATISQGLAGTETGLISGYSFNNSIVDLNTTNANNLTSNNSAVATNADSPFGGQAGGAISSSLDYGIIQTISFSTTTTVVVQVAEGCTIPTSGGVASVSYATDKNPYGFPGNRDKWVVDTQSIVQTVNTSPTNNVWYNLGLQLNIPAGSWRTYFEGVAVASISGAGGISIFSTLSTANNTQGDLELTTHNFQGGVSGAFLNAGIHREKLLNLSTLTPYYLNSMTDSSGSNIGFQGQQGTTLIRAENGWL